MTIQQDAASLTATDPAGAPVAVKVLKSSRIGTGLQRFKREFRALSKLRHPNVIRVREIAVGSKLSSVYV